MGVGGGGEGEGLDSLCVYMSVSAHEELLCFLFEVGRERGGWWGRVGGRGETEFVCLCVCVCP